MHAVGQSEEVGRRFGQFIQVIYPPIHPYPTYTNPIPNHTILDHILLHCAHCTYASHYQTLRPPFSLSLSLPPPLFSYP